MHFGQMYLANIQIYLHFRTSWSGFDGLRNVGNGPKASSNRERRLSVHNYETIPFLTSWSMLSAISRRVAEFDKQHTWGANKTRSTCVVD